MNLVAITQRVQEVSPTGERRDALDQRWHHFLAACGLAPLLIPNHPPTARSLLEALAPCGLLLTGGNTLAAYGGDAPERDETESLSIDWACQQQRPVLGVCRGMQLLQHRSGVPLVRVSGHVTAEQVLEIDGRPETVNSYHDWGTTESVDEWEVWARASDGVVKAIRHRTRPMQGIMWHPERCTTFRPADIALVRSIFPE